MSDLLWGVLIGAALAVPVVIALFWLTREDPR